MEGYQPLLLSLQDMLNDETDDDNIWSQNPYSISNFFEPIEASENQGNVGTSYEERNYLEDPLASTETLTTETCRGNIETKREEAKRSGVDKCQNDDTFDFLDLEVFDESVVTSEIREAGQVQEISQDEPESILPHFDSQASADDEYYSSKSQNYEERLKSRCEIDLTQEQATTSQVHSRGPTLKEVKHEDVSSKELEERKHLALKRKCRSDAINQLNVLICALKRFSYQLQDFLENEGDMILEHCNARSLLCGILPEIDESSNKRHPFHEANAIGQIVSFHYKGQAPVKRLPARKPHMWRGSDLLLLQQTILESVIRRREFFLNCRYTDILTQMGFDFEDLEKLNQCRTKEEELGTMTIILNEHAFYSQFKGTRKKAIETVFVTKDLKGSELPRVVLYPPPEKLVKDKWLALGEIRRKTVLSTIQDEDICWLYVLKAISEGNPRLNAVDEECCKLTYEHLLSYRYNKGPWHLSELQQLQILRQTQPKASWKELAEMLGTKRSPFSCFLKYKMHCANSNLRTSGKPLSRTTLATLKNCFIDCSGNASQVDGMLRRVLKKHEYQQCCSWMTPKKLLDICHNRINPRLRKGAFTPAEDALLLVVMEKYRDYFLESRGKLEPVGYAMPWRHSFILRSRLDTLLSTFYARRWTLEEDQRLCELVETHGTSFKTIQRFFPLRNRKTCSSRYHHLLNVLQSTNLEDYHRIYHPHSYGLKTDKLQSIANYLEMSIRSKLSGSGKCVREIDLEFLKLRRSPTDYNLDCYLMTFPISLMSKALNRLTECISQIEKIYQETPSAAGKNSLTLVERLQGLDRRKFDPKCPLSVASALHIRNATLVPQDTIHDLTDFESEIYEVYKIFALRSAPKMRTKRQTIPTLETLRKLHCISRVITPAQQVNKRGQPSVVLTIKSENLDDQEKKKEDQELLLELEERKKGGRRQGTKRRKTRRAEQLKRAALIRWQKQQGTSAEGQDNEENGSEDEASEHGGIPSVGSSYMEGSPFWEAYSPSTPATPASSVISTATSTDSEASLAPAMKKTILGMISDHAYILPMQNPIELSTLSLQQLFAKMGGGKAGKAAKQRSENQ